MSFSFSLINEWQSPDKLMESGPFVALGSGERMLVFSDGSLTLLLEAFFKSASGVEVMLNAVSSITEEAALYLSEDTCAEVIEREIWLLAGGRRQVYARSIIPSASIEGWLRDDLTDGIKPIGRILYDRGIAVLKESVELSLIRSSQVAAELSIDPDTPLVSRRYRLSNRRESGGMGVPDGDEGSGGGWIIKAMIQEVFSPTLVRVPG